MAASKARQQRSAHVPECLGFQLLGNVFFFFFFFFTVLLTCLLFLALF